VSKDAAKALDYARERAWRLAVRQVSRPKAT
jgi:hypothetical protein